MNTGKPKPPNMRPATTSATTAPATRQRQRAGSKSSTTTAENASNQTAPSSLIAGRHSASATPSNHCPRSRKSSQRDQASVARPSKTATHRSA